MRPGHPLASRPHLFVQDCQDFPMVLAEETLAARALTEAALVATSMRVLPALVTNMFEVMKHYVRLTDAIALQFCTEPSGEAARTGLTVVPLADLPLAEARLMLAVRRGRTLQHSATAVCDHLRTVLSFPAR
jgi:hypothetical protein